MNDATPLETDGDFESRLTELERATVNLINSVAESNIMIDKLSVKVEALADAQK